MERVGIELETEVPCPSFGSVLYDLQRIRFLTGLAPPVKLSVFPPCVSDVLFESLIIQISIIDSEDPVRLLGVLRWVVVERIDNSMTKTRVDVLTADNRAPEIVEEPRPIGGIEGTEMGLITIETEQGLSVGRRIVDLIEPREVTGESQRTSSEPTQLLTSTQLIDGNVLDNHLVRR